MWPRCSHQMMTRDTSTSLEYSHIAVNCSRDYILLPSGLPCDVQTVSDGTITCRTAKHEMNNDNTTIYPGEVPPPPPRLVFDADLNKAVTHVDVSVESKARQRKTRPRRHRLSARSIKARGLWCSEACEQTCCYLTTARHRGHESCARAFVELMWTADWTAGGGFLKQDILQSV